MVAAVSLGQRLVEIDRPRERACETVIVADRNRRGLDHAGGDSALAHRFERDPERIVLGGEAFDAIACVAIGFDPCRPGDIAVPDRAVAIGRARSEEHTSELQSLMRHPYAVS